MMQEQPDWREISGIGWGKYKGKPVLFTHLQRRGAQGRASVCSEIAEYFSFINGTEMLMTVGAGLTMRAGCTASHLN